MAPLQLTVAGPSGDVYPLEVEATAALSSIQGQLEAMTGIPAARQAVMCDGRPLTASATFDSAGVKSGDMLVVTSGQVPGTQAANPGALLNQLASNPAMASALGALFPALSTALQSNDPRALQQLQSQLQGGGGQGQAPGPGQGQGPAIARQGSIQEDADDMEAQQRMYDAIQQRNVQEQLDLALENTPEMFGHVEMLYVDMVVNGEPIQAFIDSGAQATIMTQTFAENCGIMRLVDKRFAGVAMGVGSSRILGRIHAVAIRVADQHIQTAITVLEQKEGPQFIFGLDNLRRHQCSINLMTNKLEIGSCKVQLPFISEAQVKHKFNVPQPAGAEGDAAAPEAPAAGPAGGNAAASGSSSSAAQLKAEQIAQLKKVTGADDTACEEALKACAGNVDQAAAQLLGFM